MNTLKVKLRTANHQGKTVILIIFKFHPDLVFMANQLNCKWSSKLTAWHLPYSSSNISAIRRMFGEIAQIEDSAMPNKSNALPKIRADLYSAKAQKSKPPKPTIKLHKGDKRLLHDYVRFLRSKRLSESTVRAYYLHVLDFVNYLNGKDLTVVDNKDVMGFIADVCVGRYAVSSHRQVISAIKQLKALKPESLIDSEALEMPLKNRYLPTVLSKEEVINILRCTQNLKHRAALALIYSCGLRIGELLLLELRHIDIDRRQLFVVNGKNRKDRYIVLAKSFLPLLRNYLHTYEPKKYFIEGREAGTLYHASSIRHVLKASCKRAGILKRVTPHTLRHSYATHLLEYGVDLRYIQELLGHARPETTMIYTHVTKKDLLQIESPLDMVVSDLLETDKSIKKLSLSRDLD